MTVAWMQYLSGQGYIIVCTDNRGTDGRGEAFKKSTYLQLGNLETEDQLALAEYMTRNHMLIRSGLVFSVGATADIMSLLCLYPRTRELYFKSGVAVHPSPTGSSMIRYTRNVLCEPAGKS